MALPTVAINGSTGSDTLASGAGPSTAVTGTLAATHANTTVNITDAVALGGVAVDGSAVLWVSSSSGRQFAKITAISGSSGAWVVTVSDALANTESGRSWAIGGKRATLQGSLRLGLDVRAGWTIDVQTDDSSLTGAFVISPDASNGLQTTFTSTVGSRATKITQSNSSTYGLDTKNALNLLISNLYFRCTAGTPGNGIGPSGTNNAAGILIYNCLIDGFKIGVATEDDGNFVRTTGLILDTVEIKNCTSAGVFQRLPLQVHMVNCWVHNNGANSQVQGSNNALVGCVFSGNAGGGLTVQMQSYSNILIDRCVFASNASGSGLTISNGSYGVLSIKDSIFYGNATYGWDLHSGTTPNAAAWVVTDNAFGANTAAAAHPSGIGTGAGAVTLTASPFNSSSDFGLNATAGGGALCKGAGAAHPASSNPAPDIGAIPSGGGGSGGGATFPVIGSSFIKGAA